MCDSRGLLLLNKDKIFELRNSEFFFFFIKNSELRKINKKLTMAS